MFSYSPAPPMISVEEFFHDDPKTPWKPLPEHDLNQSPSYPIIDIRNYHKLEILKLTEEGKKKKY
jgi:hypothetical protein